jgi:hypothetical protein
VSDRPIRCSALLRRELIARNASYAEVHQLTHVTSYGEMPVVVYQASPCGKEHGNFISGSYRAILKRPGWRSPHHIAAGSCEADEAERLVRDGLAMDRRHCRRAIGPVVAIWV